MIEQLENKIKEYLENLTYEDGIKCFYAVEDTFTLTPKGYPYAVFEIDHIGGVKLDSCNNTRVFTFKMQVFRDFESLAGTEQEKRRFARKQVAKIVDRIIDLFDKHQFLDGLVDNSELLDFQFGTYTETDGKDGKGYMVDITINLNKLLFIK